MSRPSRRASATVTYREPTEDDVFRDPEPSEVAAAERRAAKRARSASPVEVEGRGAKRRTGKESLLDALFVNHAEVEGAPDFVYSLGGADAGGAEADRILGEVESDQTMIRLTSQFSGCRRIVLFSTGRHGVKAVAAAVIELHLGGASTGGVLEVPILASARSSRAQGHGSLLTALIVELASSRLASPAQGIVPPGSQGAVALLVSSTDEARRFWLGQGCTTIPQCAQQVAAAVRGLLQRAGQRFGQQHATLMARSLPDARVLPPGPDGEAAGAPAVRGALVGAAVERTAGRVPHSGGLSCAKAAEAAGYRDVPPAGSFSLVDGKRVPALAPGAAEADGAAPATLPLGRLQAFPVSSPVSGSSTWGAPGWGVRSLAPIKAGQAVVEVCGRWRGEAEYDRLLPLERSHVLRLDERARSLLLQSGGGERGWLDLREEGSIARIVRESEEAPNLELVTYPDPSAHAPPPPESCFRLYLVAKHDIPPLAELIWERPAPGADRSHRRGRPAAAPAAASGGGKALSADAAAAGAAEAAAFRLRSGAPVVEGSEVEVRISDAELEGARYEALVLAAGRGDGLYRVRYSCLHASAHADETLKEWVQPAAEDELRPPPPPPPDGFHARLSPGDKLELLFEGGWWPVVLTSRPPPPPAAAASSAPPPPPPPKRGLGVESAIDPARFAGLTTSAPPVRLRPAWVWEGRAGGGSGGWTFETQADGCVKLDKAGRPHQPVYQPIKHATGALPAADASRDSEPAEAVPAAHAAKAEPLAAENGEHASPSAVMAKVEVECEPESSDEAGAEEEGAGGAEGGDSMDSQ